jgi:hypothetical protein
MKEKIGEKEQGNTEKRENLKSKIILWNLKTSLIPIKSRLYDITSQ